MLEDLGISKSTIYYVGEIWKVGGVEATNAWAKQFHKSEQRRVREEYHGTERLLALDAIDEMYAKLSYAILQDSMLDKTKPN